MLYRILIVLTPALRPTAGGVQMSTFKMGRRFSEDGHCVRVFSFAERGHDDFPFGELVCGVEAGSSRSKANLAALETELASFRPHIVINQMPYEHEIGRLLQRNKQHLLLGCLRNTLFSVRANLESYVARNAPGPLKLLSRSSIVQRAFLTLHRQRHRADLKRILKTYDFFVMFGPPNLDELSYFLPNFNRDKVRLIPNSIPKVADVSPPKEKRLLWLGRVAHEQKRAELILPVWQKVTRALPDWELDVVGDGPLLEYLKHQAYERNLPRIQFHGRQVADEFYGRASIFFMTSAFEGFPNTLVEAQSHATIPVIFDSYPLASWILEDSRSGFLVKPFDTDDMAHKIIDLASDDSQRRALAANVLKNARRFHIQNVGDQWQALFDSEVAKHMHPAITSGG